MKHTEIEIAVAELKSILPGLAKIVARHTTLPVLGCVKVSLDPASQVISLEANNLDEIATVRLQNKAAGVPGELLLPMNMLSQLIKGCANAQSVRLISNKSETKIRYTVAGNTVDRVVDHIPVEEFPAAQGIEGEFITLDETFKGALKEAFDCASGDSTRYVLNGACLDVRDNAAHYVVGTDGRHLYCANSFHFSLPEPLIVSTRKFLSWPGFVADGPWRLRMLPAIHVDPNDKKADKSQERPPWLQIDSEHWSYIARAIDGQYPNWKQVLPSDTDRWTRLTLQPEAVQMMQQAVPLLPGDDLVNQTIVLRVTADQVLLCAQGRDDQNETRMAVPEVRVDGKPIEVALNRTYLLQALRFGLHEVRIEDSLAPMVFCSPAKRMVVMPIRIEAQAPAPAQPASQEATPSPQPTSQAENTPTGSPSPARVETATEPTRKDTVNTTPAPITPPARGNLKAHGNGNGNGTANSAEENGSAIKAAIDQVEKIRAALRQPLSDLGDVVSALKAAEKENKAASKEVESVRQTLRSLQSVAI